MEGHMAEGRNRCAVRLVSKSQHCRSATLVILDLDVIPLTSHQTGHSEAVPGTSMFRPVINYLLTVDPHPHAIIGEHGKAIVPIALGLDLTRCPD